MRNGRFDFILNNRNDLAAHKQSVHLGPHLNYKQHPHTHTFSNE